MAATSPLHDALQRGGATFEEQHCWLTAVRFTETALEYEAARTHAAMFDYSACGKVELSGPDAVVFLHNLCTNDIKNLPAGGGCEAFLTTHKARVIAHFGVSRVQWKGNETLWLDAEPGHAARIIAQLNHFLISEQVELADRTGDVAMLRVVGPAAPALVAQALQCSIGELQPWHHAIRATPSGTVGVRFQRALGVLGFDCVCRADAAPTLWSRLLTAGVKPAGMHAHEVLRVEAGFPSFGIDMDENRFVVEVGRIDAISYTKGCYLGQEPIVMARDRGQVNRLLCGIVAGQGSVFAPGTVLMRDDAEVGQTTSSVWSPRLKQVVALAYVRRGHQEPGTELTIAPADSGRKAVVSSLPLAPVETL